MREKSAAAGMEQRSPVLFPCHADGMTAIFVSSRAHGLHRHVQGMGAVPLHEFVGTCKRLGAYALFVRDPLQAWYLRCSRVVATDVATDVGGDGDGDYTCLLLCLLRLLRLLCLRRSRRSRQR